MNRFREMLTEPSTWRGLSILGGALGLMLAPDQWVAICTGAATIWGAVDVYRKEK